MKVHNPIRQGTIQALVQTFTHNSHAEKVLDDFFKKEKKWGARDRRQVAEIFYETVRNIRLLAVYFDFAKADDDFYPQKLNESQITKIVDEFIAIDLKLPLESVGLFPPKVRYSYPNWLDEKMQAELGEVWRREQVVLHTKAPAYLRVNSLKANRDKVMAELFKSEVATEVCAGNSTALRLKERKNVFITEAYKNGFFEMQDLGSQWIAPLLAVTPGARVVDACAGAGGKTLHLAAMMGNKGSIIALDIHQWKLDELKKRARRAGANNIETRLVEGTKTIKRLHETVDFLLLDVPCTGVGVLRRHPDTKWKLTEGELLELLNTQAEILEHYSKMLRPGGVMVYATCSLLPSENEKQVERFLENSSAFQNGPEISPAFRLESEISPAFRLERELHVYPSEHDCDGFYAARIVRG